ncbi:MAG TPA: hypothetical protein VG389_26110 [Myxococcota bacterium]|jgi:hypothetical protein|nr:hypothetical protein [Myxococcota bacterium]
MTSKTTKGPKKPKAGAGKKARPSSRPAGAAQPKAKKAARTPPPPPEPMGIVF